MQALQCLSFIKCHYLSILGLEISVAVMYVNAKVMTLPFRLFGDDLIFVGDSPACWRQEKLDPWLEQWSGRCQDPNIECIDPRGHFLVPNGKKNLTKLGSWWILSWHMLTWLLELQEKKWHPFWLCWSNGDLRSSWNSGIAGHPDLPEMENWLRNWRESYVPSSTDWVFMLQPWPTGLLYYSTYFASASLFIYVSFQLSSFFTLPTSSSWGESDWTEGHMVTLSQSALSKEGVLWYRPWPPVFN